MRFEITDGKFVSAAAYRDFATLIRNLTKRSGERACSVITFNYDVAVDLALHGAGLKVNYGLTNDTDGQANLFKLHGSVSWHRCSVESCKKIAPVVIPRFDKFANVAPVKWSFLRKQFGFQRLQCCNHDVTPDCVIVPPSWNKSEYRSSLVNVWQRAAAELKSATNIFVCGYSLPDTDSFFRYLFALGTCGPELLERFWVFDPSEESHQRFRSLLGPGARARFAAYPHKFEQAVSHLNSTLVERN